MRERRAGTAFAVAAIAALATACSALAEDVPLPGLEAATRAGGGRTVTVSPVRPGAKLVDGGISDWRGSSPGFAGASMYSRGEFVYQDHVFDAYGAASDRDAAYFGTLGAAGIEQLEPRTHRPLETTYEFGNDSEGFHFGQAPLQSAADLLELRLASDASSVHVLARTTSMLPSDRSALLLLADTTPGASDVEVPFGADIHSQTADIAVLLSSGRALVADLHTGAVRDLGPHAVATNPDGYVNAIEAAVPRALVARGGTLRLAAATGTLGDDGRFAALPGEPDGAPRLANVAFRAHEPVEPAFDREQALSLHDGTIDPFFTDIDLGALTRGRTQHYEPGPGYHARSFTVSPGISDEFLNRGIHREYGVYLPASFRANRRWPLVTFLHGSSLASGPSNHTYATLLPGFLRDFGDDAGSIVIVPNDRQPRTPDSEQGNEVGFGDWMGESLVELNTVWSDASKTFALDPSRNYLTGYSMGGYGAYELGALMPDRWAAVMPIAGQVSSGDYSGVDFEGCSQLSPPQIPGVDPNLTQIQRGDACYPTSRPNRTTDPPYEGYGLRHPDPRATNMLKIAENVLNEPFAIFSPLEDENQLYTNNLSAARTFNDLGYRYRMWTFLAEEHESPGIFDEWSEAERYLFGFKRDPSPPEVRFARDMPLEHEVERGTGKVANPNVQLRFASAYWVREIDPVDPSSGHAAVEARSLAIPDPPHQADPEAGSPAAPGQSAPHLTLGQAWASSGTPAPTSNGFTASVTGAESLTLDLAGMRIDATRAIAGDVTTEHDLTLLLSGRFGPGTSVSVDGNPVPIRFENGALAIELAPGEHAIRVSPR